MAVFNCNFNRRWHDREDCKPLTGVRNEMERVPFISSNGYYGFLPMYGKESDAMDTSDVNELAENVTGESRPNFTCSGNQQYLNHEAASRNGFSKATLPPRKRNSAEDLDENFKRIRKEEPVKKCPSDNVFQLNHSWEESSKELMESLLKNIHGCDMYNFYSTDDI